MRADVLPDITPAVLPALLKDGVSVTSVRISDMILVLVSNERDNFQKRLSEGVSHDQKESTRPMII